MSLQAGFVRGKSIEIYFLNIEAFGHWIQFDIEVSNENRHTAKSSARFFCAMFMFVF